MSHIDETFVVGRINSVSTPAVNDQLLHSTGMVVRNQQAQIEILEGPLKGTMVVVPNEITDNPAYNISATPGKEVILSVVKENNGKPEINIADYHRAPVLGILLLVFLVVFLYFGGKNGVGQGHLRAIARVASNQQNGALV